MAAIFAQHIDAMLDAVMKAIGKEDLREEATGRLVREAIESCWVDTGAITWTVEDILGEYPALTRDQARAVLHEMVHEHDATIGISWDNLGSYVRRAVPDYDADAEDAAVLAKVKAYAGGLVAAGHKTRLMIVFDTVEPTFDPDLVDYDELREIYREYVLGEEDGGGSEGEGKPVELLVTISSNLRPDQGRAQIAAVAATVGKEPSSVDVLRNLTDILFHCATVEEAEAMAARADALDFVTGTVVHNTAD